MLQASENLTLIVKVMSPYGVRDTNPPTHMQTFSRLVDKQTHTIPFEAV